MTARIIVAESVVRAFECLNDAAADLTVAATFATTNPALANDARILAEAVEREMAAVLAMLHRHA